MLIAILKQKTMYLFKVYITYCIQILGTGINALFISPQAPSLNMYYSIAWKDKACEIYTQFIHT